MKLTDDEVRGNMTERQSLIHRLGDLKARFLLLDMAEQEYAAGNLIGAARLTHMMDYLADRLVYELEPPPTETSIRIVSEPEAKP